jgi:hypothetical protein
MHRWDVLAGDGALRAALIGSASRWHPAHVKAVGNAPFAGQSRTPLGVLTRLQEAMSAPHSGPPARSVRGSVFGRRDVAEVAVSEGHCRPR